MSFNKTVWSSLLTISLCGEPPSAENHLQVDTEKAGQLPVEPFGFPYHLTITAPLEPDTLIPMPRATGPTRKLPYDPVAAVAALSAADPKLARLIARAGPFTVRLPRQQSPFEALLRAIVYQQIHGNAALAIHTRLIASFSPHLPPNTPANLFLHPSPEQLLDAPKESLRAAGLSANKALAIRDLAAKTLDGTVPTLAQIRRMSDADIIEHLTQVRGIGKWTVEMLLIFRIGRPNVLPTSDFGIRKGFALTFLGLKPTTKLIPDLLATPAQIEKRAKKWQPWCSVASWYMWRACDLAAGKVVQPE